MLYQLSYVRITNSHDSNIGTPGRHRGARHSSQPYRLLGPQGPAGSVVVAGRFVPRPHGQIGLGVTPVQQREHAHHHGQTPKTGHSQTEPGACSPPARSVVDIYGPATVLSGPKHPGGWLEHRAIVGHHAGISGFCGGR